MSAAPTIVNILGSASCATIFATVGVPPFTAEDIIARFLVSFCTALGAILSVSVDPPALRKDVAVRVGVGAVVGFLFAQWIAGYAAQQLGVPLQLNGMIAVCGVLGIASWYLLNLIVLYLKSPRFGDWLTRLFAGRGGPNDAK